MSKAPETSEPGEAEAGTEVVVEATVKRADGSEEDLGEISRQKLD